MSEAEKLRLMAEAFRQLHERDRAIFGSVRFDDLDYVETAKLHACSVQEVEDTIARVMFALSRAAQGLS